MASTGKPDLGSDNGKGATNASGAAMNLFEHYSLLNRGIDETRSEMKRTREKIDEINDSIQKSKQERDSMQREIVAARKEANDFHGKIDEAQSALSKVEDDYSRAKMEKDRAQRELDNLKAFIDQSRQDFLDQSREFRASCKRARFSASELGLEYPAIRAFATVVSDMPSSRSVSPGDFQENDDGFFRPAKVVAGDEDDTTLIHDATSDSAEQDPRKWIADPRDEDMKEALGRYNKERGEFEQVKTSLDELKTKRKALQDQATEKSKKKEQLVTQMNRIKSENVDLERQIEEFEANTLEAKEIGKTLEKSKHLIFCCDLSPPPFELVTHFIA
jgi:chromosome segregation ATPase